MTPIRHIVFDIGNVLLPWHRDRPFRTLIPDAGERERFLREVCSMEWHLTLDAGEPVEAAIAALAERHPEQADLIRAYRTGWLDMFEGADEEVVAILSELIGSGHDVTALTNFNQDLYAITVPAFPFLGWFRGVTVSGAVRLTKPDPAIYARHAESCALAPAATLFFDDSPPNVAAAREAGWHAELFTGAGRMAEDLARYGIPLTHEESSANLTSGSGSTQAFP
ncbi:HAD family hydrolase [Faunimonas sp. B44]|uniref:HAD family hydrolase n=1 Tax=Faunimonas sp. B44 TaxID=3461493 RepID=UPI0040444D97